MPFISWLVAVALFQIEELLFAGPVSVHGPDRPSTVPVRGKGDHRPVGGEGSQAIVGRAVGQLHQAAAVGVYGVDFPVIVTAIGHEKYSGAEGVGRQIGRVGRQAEGRGISSPTDDEVEATITPAGPVVAALEGDAVVLEPDRRLAKYARCTCHDEHPGVNRGAGVDLILDEDDRGPMPGAVYALLDGIETETLTVRPPVGTHILRMVAHLQFIAAIKVHGKNVAFPAPVAVVDQPPVEGAEVGVMRFLNQEAAA